MGLAPLIVGQLYEQVAEIARQGVAVAAVVEQFAAAVLGIADHAAVLVRGRVAHQGRPDQGFRDRTGIALSREFRMTSTETRADRFIRELAELKIPDPAAGRSSCGCGSASR